jgi:ubiquinone/menaquinone biosynthesis C-methylase UbiE
VRWSGNTGKARIQRDVLALQTPHSIIDIGAIGTGPMDLWKHMPLKTLPHRIVAVDPDAAGVERARQLDLPIELLVANGYELSRVVASASFDIAICTQVLEHVARPLDFLLELRRVLRPRGVLWLTVDSAHFSKSKYGDPLWKRMLRPVAARFREAYYDFGLTEQKLRESLTTAGFEITELRHCNLGPLKPLFSQLPDPQKESFLEAWTSFEEQLHRSNFTQPQMFRAIYTSARAVE